VYSKDFNDVFFQEVEILKALNQRDYIMNMIEYSDSPQNNNNNIIIHNPDRFIAFENIGDHTLLELVKAEEMTVVNAANDILEALNFIHANGIIMRNLRLESVYLVGPVNNLRIKIGDFTHAIYCPQGRNVQKSSSMGKGEKGAEPAQEDEKDQDVEDILLQSSLCQAPELYSLAEGLVDYTMDIWSFGMIIFILLTAYFPVDEILEIQENIDENHSVLEELMKRLIETEVIWPSKEAKAFIKEILKINPTERAKGPALVESLKDKFSNRNQSVTSGLLTKSPSTRIIQTTTTFKQSVMMTMAVNRFKKLKEDSERKGVEEEREMTAMTVPKKTNPFKKAVLTIIAANRFQNRGGPRGQPQHQEQQRYQSQYQSKFAKIKPSPTTTICPLPDEAAAQAIFPSSSLVALTALNSEDKLINRGRYTLITSLMTGNDFNIYAGILSSTNGKVFVKRIRVKNQQYDTELTILRLLNNHPCISQFVDCIEENIERYLIIERLDDGCLIDLLNMNGQTPVTHLNENRIKSIAQGLVKAVDFMHSKRVIHRGLSLANITIKVLNENEITCKIWNFHTATSADRCHEKPLPATFLSATDAYCVAPELLFVLANEKNHHFSHSSDLNQFRSYYDIRVDMWSIGVILYSLMEKQAPFLIGDPLSVLSDINLTGELLWTNSGISPIANQAAEGLLKSKMEERMDSESNKALLEWIGVTFNTYLANGNVSVVPPSQSTPATTTPTYSRPTSAVKAPEPMEMEIASYLARAGNPVYSSYYPPTVHPPSAPVFPMVGGAFPLPVPGPITVSSSAVAFTPVQATEETNEEEMKGKQYDVQLKYYQEKILDRKNYYLKYFEFLKALEEDEERADKLHDELMEIDPKGEEKVEFKESSDYKTAISSAMERLQDMINFYKGVTKDKVKAYSKAKQLREMKANLQEILQVL
jgi:serine/threonine protein kinase